MSYYQDILGVSDNPFPEAGVARSIEDASVFYWSGGKNSFHSLVENQFTGDTNILVWNAELGFGKSHTFFYMKKFIEENHKEWLCSYVTYDQVLNGIQDILSCLLSEAFEISLMAELENRYLDPNSMMKELGLNHTYLPEVELFWNFITKKTSESLISIESKKKIEKKLEILLKLLKKKFDRVIFQIDQFEDILHDERSDSEKRQMLQNIRAIADRNPRFFYIVIGADHESWDFYSEYLHRGTRQRANVYPLAGWRKKDEILGFIRQYLLPSKRHKEFLRNLDDKTIKIISEKTNGRPRDLVRVCHYMIEELRKKNISDRFTVEISKIFEDSYFWSVALRNSKMGKKPAWNEPLTSEITFHLFRNLNGHPRFFFEIRKKKEETLVYWIGDLHVFDKSKKKWIEKRIYCSNNTWREFRKSSGLNSLQQESILICKDPPSRKPKCKILDSTEIDNWINQKKASKMMDGLGHFNLDMQDSLDFIDNFLPELYELGGDSV